MKRWWKQPRKLVLGNTVYLWSLLDRPQYRELRVFREREKQPVFRLWLTYPECWAIDLFRPGAAACIIGWHEGRGYGRYGKPVILQEEPALLQCICASPFPRRSRRSGRGFWSRSGAWGRGRQERPLSPEPLLFTSRRRRHGSPAKWIGKQKAKKAKKQ